MLSITFLSRKSRFLLPGGLFEPAKVLKFHNQFVYYAQHRRTKAPHVQEQTQILEDQIELFPEPKLVLHNYYQVLSTELKKPNLSLPKPQFKQIHLREKGKSNWNCIYKLPWPEEIKIEAVASTKQDASKRAAAKALNVLKRAEKITHEGFPVIYDRESEISDANKPIKLVLNPSIVDRLDNIVKIYDNINKGEVNKVIERTNENKSDTFSMENEVEYQQMDKQYFQRNSTNTPILPILDYKNEIIKTIQENQVVIIRGEPGCGKSTQVPQYIYDHWFESSTSDYQHIIISEPRRIAATSLAERVANERDEALGETVGYHVRLDSIYNKDTGAILYCTSGILLKHIQNDPNLRAFTHVILDEAHERDVNTDLLMVLLRKAIKTNPKLKVIVMSATIDVELFQKYFDNAPIIQIPGFAYPVKSYFLEDLDIRIPKTMEGFKNDNPVIVPDDICKVINWIHSNKKEGAILCFLPGWDDIIKVKRQLEDHDRTKVVFPLHSKLTLKDQRRIFQPLTPGARKIILATNIAETSVTIDDVVYVIDTGAHKEQRLDKTKELECVDNYWISQANVNQRRGRAGRVRPGECYHLYSKSKFDEMETYQIPVILRVSLTKIVLDTKVYDEKTKAIDFFKELPNPPEDKAVLNAVAELQDLKVLDDNEQLTPLGKTIALFSMSPMLSKTLVYSYFFQCVEPILDIVTVLSLDSDFFASTSAERKSDIRGKKSYFSKDSDHIAFHKFMVEWRDVSRRNDRVSFTWCQRNYINEYKMKLCSRLRDVHLKYLMNFKSRIPISNKYADNNTFVKSILAAGLNKILYNKTIVSRRHQKKNLLVSESGQTATITSESVNFKRKLPQSEFYCYSNDVHSITRRTTIVRETSLISPLSVLLLANMFRIKSINDEFRFVNVNDRKLQIELDEDQMKLITKVQDIVDEMVQFLCACHLQSIVVEDSDIYQSWCDIVNDLAKVLK